MRRSEFVQFVVDEFGESYGQVLIVDTVLTELGDLTAAVALDSGCEPRDVWLALCRQEQVPQDRWAGVPVQQRRGGQEFQETAEPVTAAAWFSAS